MFKPIIVVLPILLTSFTLLANEVEPSGITVFEGGTPARAEDVNNTIQTLIDAVNDNARRLSVLETEVSNTPVTDTTRYDGTYTVTVLESALFGCQKAGSLDNTDMASSSVSTRSGMFEAVSAEGILSFPGYTLSRHEIRLHGALELDTMSEGSFMPTIDSGGAIAHSAADFSGQFSADGNVFSILIRGSGPEDGCNGAYTISMIGVRQ